MSTLPVVGITMGDPSGIGPEIIIKALSDNNLYKICRPVVFGDPGALTCYVKAGEKITINEISGPEQIRGIPFVIDLVPVTRLPNKSMIPGNPTINGGKAMVKYITLAVDLAMQGKIAGIVTCPINKSLMNRAGYNYEGHTQLIAHLTGTDSYVMMLAGKSLRVTLVTIHCALRDVPASLDKHKIVKTIRITSNSLVRDFGINNPLIAVAALNPHAGESGLFGDEEKKIIRPAVEIAIEEGLNVVGPLPADTLYPKITSRRFDAVVSMYHDQGLIPLKLLHFSDAVNTTLGLPIVRTSVDHGTAYDIAGKHKADPSSLKAAVRMAVEIIENRAKLHTTENHEK
ncbi:MAG: 4-hydroxythreonine-4-phosphate dehydrogenase PdxA [Deltaproteobacteria bacterium]|nr:4-hydroxythreonine-4-phosphate dehydrogenase PdxA [Deltaproteobacteria bacterium]